MSILNKDHKKALKLAVKYGCNLIDTSSNYQYGESENLIGKFIEEYPRKKLFVVTKAGYVTRNEMRALRGLKKKSLGSNDIVSLDTTTHCIHPDFLQHQIKKSLKRLNRKWLDGFLIHNPEYYLKSKLTEVKKEVYYRRIKQSFELLEELASKGTISYYGVSSNTLSIHDYPSCTSLHELLRISAEVASKNRFRLIQFPFNLFEHQPVSEHNGNGNMISVAQQNNLITFSNRPLNCHTPQGFIRLACYEAITDDEVIASEAAHKNFMELITKKLRVFGIESDPFEFEIIAHLDKHWKTIGNHSAVDKLFAEYLRPFLNNFYNDSIPEKDFISSNMATTERNVILRFYEACKKFSTQIMSQRCSEAIETLKNNGRFPSDDTRSLPVIACDQYLKNRIDHVLAGMTKEKYVEEMRGLF